MKDKIENPHDFGVIFLEVCKLCSSYSYEAVKEDM